MSDRQRHTVGADAGSHPGPYGWYLDDSIRVA